MPNFEAVLSNFPFLSVLLVGAMCRSFIYLIKIHENHHIKWADVEGYEHADRFEGYTEFVIEMVDLMKYSRYKMTVIGCRVFDWKWNFRSAEILQSL